MINELFVGGKVGGPLKVERKAAMNPDAVTQAKVYHGGVFYFDRYRKEHITLPQVTLVEVGKWSTAGAEKSPDDYLCTFYAATLLGFHMDWLTYDEQTGDRKYFIGAGINEKGELISLSEEHAEVVADAINQVYNLASRLQLNLVNVDTP